MIQEIKYNGFTANPSDYECGDGELAMSLGLVPEDGALKPVLPPKELLKLGNNQKVVFIHETAAFKYYIIHNSTNNAIYYKNADPESDQTLKWMYSFTETVTIYSFNAIGNTLVVLTSEGVRYFLWKSLSEGYLHLGTHLPECPISFGLQGEMIRGDEFTIQFDNIEFFEGDVWKDFTDNNKTRITDQVLAKVNKFIADNSTNVGKFMYPFFVRYAYRLYDGSLTMHSAPVLMVCSSDLAPQCFVTNLHGNDTSTAINQATLRLCGMFHQLDYAVIGQGSINELKNWNDIIKSVDVFVSAPIYTYNQAGECTKFLFTDYSDCYAVCKNISQAASQSVYPLRYQKSRFAELYAMTFDPTNFTAPSWRLMLPQRDGDAIKGDITDNALFYFLKSINVTDLKTTRTIIPVDKEYLQSLVTREVMTDDYDSHDTLIPKYSYNYNSRFNIANLRKMLFDGFASSCLFQFTDGNVHKYSDLDDPTYMDRKVSVAVYYFIKQDGKDIVVHGDADMFGLDTPFLWLFYPNANAYKAVLAISDYSTYYYEAKLEPHPTLNGAFYFGGWDGLNVEANKIANSPTISSDRSIDVPNKIYISEVNNPFYFPVLGINTIGTGTIIGICSAAKALSQGQFGQFPLYAFSTDGVWALEVSSTGTYSAKQPITRDVCINPDSITQIDSAVLFATDRGIMLISGSETVCLSEGINSKDYFTLAELPRADKLIEIYNGRAGKDEQITLENSSLMPFRDFLTDCRMIYDYTNQRIIVYNPSVSYAYVYSLKSKLWGMIHSNISDNVNSYPDAMAMLSDNTLANFSLSDASGITALVVSRPFKLGYPDALKTIDTIIQRGYFRRDHVSQILYGSRDLFNWHIVWSSTDKYLRGFRGTPYKYFRLALIGKLDKVECIDGCTVQFTPRLTNKPR